MLQNLEIQNYRLFQNLKIEDFARINLIVGKNNVGKSSLLEALHLLISQRSPMAALDFLESRENFSSRAPSPHRSEYELASLYFGHGAVSTPAICLHGTGEASISLEIKRNPGHRKADFIYGNGQTTQISLNLENDGIRIASGHLKAISHTLPNSTYVTTKGFDYNFLAELWDKIELTPQEQTVINVLQILEPRLERISFPSSRATNSGIRLKLKGQDQPMPLTSMGDGMHRILMIAFTLVFSKNRYLLIDEIDTGLHYRTITELWRLIFETAEKLNVQVFATTHSLDCIRSFAEAIALHENKDVGAIFRLQRRGDDIQAVRYDGERLILAVEQDIEVR
ncbi:MAG: AAA family ATPase [Ardenticatenaceae bacterium]|nr:AAA family ATPase [Ardenticatenaceae bacterium]